MIDSAPKEGLHHAAADPRRSTYAGLVGHHGGWELTAPIRRGLPCTAASSRFGRAHAIKVLTANADRGSSRMGTGASTPITTNP